MRVFLTVFLLCISAQAAMINSCSDWEAQRWAQNNIPNNGGTISGKSYLTATRYMQEIKWWGIRPRIGLALLYIGDNTNAVQTPIIYDWIGGTVTNSDLVAFASGDYTEATGLTGNTTTKYLRASKSTGLNLATYTNGRNLHMAAYVRTGSNEASDVAGTGDAGGTYGLGIANSGNTYVFMGANTVNAADSNGKGFYLSTRTATNNAVTYKNGSALVTDSGNDAGALGNVAYVVHAININGSVVANTSRALSYNAVGFSIPSTMQNPYYIAVHAVQVSTSARNVE